MVSERFVNGATQAGDLKVTCRYPRVAPEMLALDVILKERLLDEWEVGVKVTVAGKEPVPFSLSVIFKSSILSHAGAVTVNTEGAASIWPNVIGTVRLKVCSPLHVWLFMLTWLVNIGRITFGNVSVFIFPVFFEQKPSMECMKTSKLWQSGVP